VDGANFCRRCAALTYTTDGAARRLGLNRYEALLALCSERVPCTVHDCDSPHNAWPHYSHYAAEAVDELAESGRAMVYVGRGGEWLQHKEVAHA
jgi:hypothetical protein